MLANVYPTAIGGGFFSSLSHIFDSSPRTSSSSPANLRSSGPSSSQGDMTVSDPSSERVSDSQPTEPRGDDFAKMVTGAIKSMMEYEEVKKNPAGDKRPTAIFYDGLG